jgi:transporter family protein
MTFSTQYFLIAVVAGIIASFALLSLFKGIKQDRISIVSPIASAWPIITIPLAIIFLSEGLTFLEAIGAFLVILGIIVTALKIKQLRKIKFHEIGRGVKYGLITLCSWGVMYFLIGFISKNTFWFVAPFFVIVVEVIMFSLYVFIKKENVRNVSKRAVAPIIFGSIFNVVASLSFGFGSQYGNVAILSPLSAASPLLIVMLAYIFLKEKLILNEKFGIIMILVGTILLAF